MLTSSATTARASFTHLIAAPITATTMSSTRRRPNKNETVPLTTADESSLDDDDGEHLSRTDQWLTYIMYKLHALLWITIASALAIYTQLYEVIVDGHPPARPEAELNRFAFNVGLAGFGGWCLMAAYLILWLKYIRKIPGEWEEYWPQAIPLATAMAVGSIVG